MQEKNLVERLEIDRLKKEALEKEKKRGEKLVHIGFGFLIFALMPIIADPIMFFAGVSIIIDIIVGMIAITSIVIGMVFVKKGLPLYRKPGAFLEAHEAMYDKIQKEKESKKIEPNALRQDLKPN